MKTIEHCIRNLIRHGWAVMFDAADESAVATQDGRVTASRNGVHVTRSWSPSHYGAMDKAINLVCDEALQRES